MTLPNPYHENQIVSIISIENTKRELATLPEMEKMYKDRFLCNYVITETQKHFVKINDWWFHYEDVELVEPKLEKPIEKSPPVLFDPENLTI